MTHARNSMRRFNHPLDRLPQLEGLLRHGLLTKIMRRPPPPKDRS